MKLISCRKSWSCEFGWGSQLFQVLSSSGESHSRAWMVRVQSLTPRALTVAGQPQLRIGWTGWEGDSEMLLSVPISGQPMSPLGTLGEGGSAGPPSWTPPPPLASIQNLHLAACLGKEEKKRRKRKEEEIAATKSGRECTPPAVWWGGKGAGEVPLTPPTPAQGREKPSSHPPIPHHLGGKA